MVGITPSVFDSVLCESCIISYLEVYLQQNVSVNLCRMLDMCDMPSMSVEIFLCITDQIFWSCSVVLNQTDIMLQNVILTTQLDLATRCSMFYPTEGLSNKMLLYCVWFCASSRTCMVALDSGWSSG